MAASNNNGNVDVEYFAWELTWLSGNGITEENVCEGGPPTKIETFNGTPLSIAFF